MSVRRVLLSLVSFLFAIVALSPVDAAVEISFYSKEFGATFPHAFIRLTGTVNGSGEPVDANYGFTAKSVTPAVLMGSVAGEIISSKPSYVAKSDRHFAFTISDEEYRKVLATVEKWRMLDQPSYNLNSRNCVFFAADIARTLGMSADTPKPLLKKPRSYLQFLTRSNRDWLASRHATVAD